MKRINSHFLGRRYLRKKSVRRRTRRHNKMDTNRTKPYKFKYLIEAFAAISVFVFFDLINKNPSFLTWFCFALFFGMLLSNSNQEKV